MMEWNDIGIKDAADVLACLKQDASARDLLALYGERIAPLLAKALDVAALKRAGDEALGVGPADGDVADRIDAAGVESGKRAEACRLNRESHIYHIAASHAYFHAARMVREAGPTVPRAAVARVVKILEALDGMEQAAALVRDLLAAPGDGKGR